MPVIPTRVLMGMYFFPRGGSAHVCRAAAVELERSGLDVTVVSGSRSDLGELAEASPFYSGLDVRAVDFTPALHSADPLRYSGPPGSAPIHGSYEARADAEDSVLACIDDRGYELQVATWTRELRLAGAGDADLLYLHHLTPLNEAAARAFPELPVLGHIHGTELLMLERIAAGAPEEWAHADAWAERLRGWAQGCERIVVSNAEGLARGAALLDLDPERFVCAPNGFDERFAPRRIDRRAHWSRRLVESPRGWKPRSPQGSIAYEQADLEALDGTVLLYVGRFTAVKRLALLIEAFALAQAEFDTPTALVLVGGHPGEWEDEHPAETIERLGCPGVFLAGWHSHDDLPDFLRASDVLVHASVHEQFGQVLVEAMACELPVIAVDRGGPAEIVDDPETGWLVPPDDADALVAAMVAAVNDPAERRVRGQRARGAVVDRYAWRQIGTELAALARSVAAPPAEAPAEAGLASE